MLVQYLRCITRYFKLFFNMEVCTICLIALVLAAIVLFNPFSGLAQILAELNIAFLSIQSILAVYILTICNTQIARVDERLVHLKDNQTQNEMYKRTHVRLAALLWRKNDVLHLYKMCFFWSILSLFLNLFYWSIENNRVNMQYTIPVACFLCVTFAISLMLILHLIRTLEKEAELSLLCEIYISETTDIPALPSN